MGSQPLHTSSALLIDDDDDGIATNINENEIDLMDMDLDDDVVRVERKATPAGNQQPKEKLGWHTSIDDVRRVVQDFVYAFQVHPRKPYYALMNLSNSMLTERSPNVKFDTAVRIWKALEVRTLTDKRRPIEFLPEIFTALMKVHVATSTPCYLPIFDQELARRGYMEDEGFLLIKARAASQICDVPSTKRTIDKLVNNHAFDANDSRLTGALLTALLNNDDFVAASRVIAGDGSNDAPSTSFLLNSRYIQFMHHCGKSGNVAALELALKAMNDAGVVNYSIRYFNSLISAFAVAGNMSGVYEATVARNEHGSEIDAELETNFMRACLAGDFEDAAELSGSYLDQNQVTKSSTISGLFEAFKLRGDSERGLELLTFLDGLGWRTQTIDPRKLWVLALELFASTGDYTSAVQLIDYLIADDVGKFDNYMAILAYRAIANAPNDTITSEPEFRATHTNRLKVLSKIDKMVEVNAKRLHDHLHDIGALLPNENHKSYSAQIWEARIQACSNLVSSSNRWSTLYDVDKQIKKMTRFKWRRGDSVLAARLKAISNSFDFTKFQADPTDKLQNLIVDADKLVESTMKQVEYSFSLGKSIHPDVAEALIELEIKTQPLDTVLQRLESLQNDYGLHGANGLPYKPIVEHLSKNGNLQGAIDIIKRMQSQSIFLRPIYFRPIFRKCSQTGDISAALEAFALLGENNVPISQETVDCLTTTFCKANDFNAIESLFKDTTSFDPIGQQAYANLLGDVWEHFGEEKADKLYRVLKSSEAVNFSFEEFKSNLEDMQQKKLSEAAAAEEFVDEVDEDLKYMTENVLDTQSEGNYHKNNIQLPEVEEIDKQLSPAKQRPVVSNSTATSDSLTLFVYRLPDYVKESDIKAAFSDYQVARVNVFGNRQKFATVAFDKKEHFDNALSRSGELVVGKQAVYMKPHESKGKPASSDIQSQLRNEIQKLQGEGTPMQLELTDALKHYESMGAVNLTELSTILTKYFPAVPDSVWYAVIRAYMHPDLSRNKHDRLGQFVKEEDLKVFESGTICLTNPMLIECLTALSSHMDKDKPLRKVAQRLIHQIPTDKLSTAAKVKVFDYYMAVEDRKEAKIVFSSLAEDSTFHSQSKRRLLTSLVRILITNRDFTDLSKLLDAHFDTLSEVDDVGLLQLVNGLVQTQTPDGKKLGDALFRHGVKVKNGAGVSYTHQLKLIEYYASISNLEDAQKVYNQIELEGGHAGDWAQLFLLRAYVKQTTSAEMQHAEDLIEQIKLSNTSHSGKESDKISFAIELMIQGYSNLLLAGESEQEEVFDKLKLYLNELAGSGLRRGPKRETLMALSKALAHDSVKRIDLFNALLESVDRDGDKSRMVHAFMVQMLHKNKSPDANAVLNVFRQRTSIAVENWKYLLEFCLRGKNRKNYESCFEFVNKLQPAHDLERKIADAHIQRLGFAVKKDSLADEVKKINFKTLNESQKQKIRRIFASHDLVLP